MVRSYVTVELEDDEIKVPFGKKYPHFWAMSLGGTGYISMNPGIVPEADDVAFVPEKGTCSIANERDAEAMYISGTGKFQLCGTYDAECPFKTGSKGGGSGGIQLQTPETLGYVSDGCKIFLDGVYNLGYEHNNGMSTMWLNLADKSVLGGVTRSAGTIENNCYVKTTDYTDSAFVGINPIEYESFTVEIVFEMTDFYRYGEQDIMSNFASSGFGVSVESGKLLVQIHANGGYQALDLGTPVLNQKYYARILYYGNLGLPRYEITGGILGGVIENKTGRGSHSYSSTPIALGMAGNKLYYEGQYKFYRFAIYNKVLNGEEKNKNYLKDVERFG